MDFISEVAAGNVPVAKDIEHEGTTGVVHVRKLNGRQKLDLVRGKKYNFDGATKAVSTIEIDLESNEQDRHKMVQFCICDEKGKDRFKSLGEVGALPDTLIEKLYRVAKDHNKNALVPEEDPGEA